MMMLSVVERRALALAVVVAIAAAVAVLPTAQAQTNSTTMPSSDTNSTIMPSSDNATDCASLNMDYCRATPECHYVDNALSCFQRGCDVYTSYSLCAGDPEGFGDCSWDNDLYKCYSGDAPRCDMYSVDCPSSRCRQVSGYCEDQDSSVARCEDLGSTDCQVTAGCILVNNQCKLGDGSCSVFGKADCATHDECDWLSTYDTCWPTGVDFPCEDASDFTLVPCPEHCDTVNTTTDSRTCVVKGWTVPCSSFDGNSCPLDRCSVKGTGIRVCYDPNLPFDCHKLDPDSCSAAEECKMGTDMCFDRSETAPCDKLTLSDCSAAPHCRVSCPGGGAGTCVDCGQMCKPDDANCGSLDDCLGSDEVECESNSACIWMQGAGQCVPNESDNCFPVTDEAECLDTFGCMWEEGSCQQCPEEGCPTPEGRPCSFYDQFTCPGPRCTYLPDLGECGRTPCEAAFDNTTCLALSGCAYFAPGNICYNATAGEELPCNRLMPDACENYDYCVLIDTFCQHKDDVKPCITHESEDSCPLHRCQWVFKSQQCHSLVCEDIFDPESCKYANCTLDEFSNLCYNDTGVACEKRAMEDCTTPCVRTDEACRSRQCSDARFEQEKCELIENCKFSDDQCVFDDGGPCTSFQLESCPARCYTDFAGGVCRLEMCSDQVDEQACAEFGCSFHPQVEICQNDTGLACSAYTDILTCPYRCRFADRECKERTCADFKSFETCERNEFALACSYITVDDNEYCVRKDQPTPCYVYHGHESDCPLDRCTWNELDSLCENSTEKIDCVYYTHAETCQRFSYCMWSNGLCDTCKEQPCATIAPPTTSTTSTTTTTTTTTAAANMTTASPMMTTTMKAGGNSTVDTTKSTTASGGLTTTMAVTTADGGTGTASSTTTTTTTTTTKEGGTSKTTGSTTTKSTTTTTTTTTTSGNVKLTLDSGSVGIVAQGREAIVIAEDLQYDATSTSTYTVTVSASNPRAAASDVVTTQVNVHVLPFLDQTTPADASAVVFNMAVPDPCLDYPDADYCRNLGRSASNRLRYEVWTRRNFNCEPALCNDQEVVVATASSSATACMCRVFGKGDAGYSAGVSTYTLDGLLPDTTYEFQLRAYDSSDAKVGTSAFYPLRTTQFAPTGVALVRQNDGLYNVSWQAPRQPNGALVGYRACYCDASIAPATCACGIAGAVQVPQGITTRTWVLAPDDGSVLPANEEYTFVVEAVTTLSDGTPTQERSNTVSTTLAVNEDDVNSGGGGSGSGGNTSASGSANALGSGVIAGIALAGVLLVLLVIVIVVQLQRQNQRSGMTDLARLYGNGGDGGSTGGGKRPPSMFVDNGNLFELPVVGEEGVMLNSSSNNSGGAGHPSGLLMESTFQGHSGAPGNGMSRVMLVGGSAGGAMNESEDHGFWDYYVKERADQFLAGAHGHNASASGMQGGNASNTTMAPWPQQGQEPSMLHHKPLVLDGDDGGGLNTTSTNTDAMVADASQQQQPDAYGSSSSNSSDNAATNEYSSSARASRGSFGLRAPRVLGNGLGGIQVATRAMRSDSIAGVVTGKQVMEAAEQDGVRAQAGVRFRGTQASGTRIDARDVEVRFHEMRQKGAVDVEFERLQQESAHHTFAMEVGTQTYNVRKNRYGNVIPLDDTRVLLKATGQLGSDYINANYMPSMKRAPAFVVSQAPVPATIADFWRMVWEQRAGVVVMVTREVEKGKIKCHKYWPDAPANGSPGGTDNEHGGDGVIYAGRFEVRHVQRQVDADGGYELRTFSVRDPEAGETREIRHFAVTSWPDHDVPESAAAIIKCVLDVRRAVETQRTAGLHGPAVVHCSAGVGRSGVFVALHNCMQQLEMQGAVDVYATVLYMRTFRAGSVQTLSQYRFIYDAVLAYFRSNAPQLLQVGTTAHGGGGVGVDGGGAGVDGGGLHNVSASMARGQPVTRAPTDDVAADPEYLIHALAQI